MIASGYTQALAVPSTAYKLYAIYYHDAPLDASVELVDGGDRGGGGGGASRRRSYLLSGSIAPNSVMTCFRIYIRSINRNSLGH
jgi:hypothetical protein